MSYKAFVITSENSIVFRSEKSMRIQQLLQHNLDNDVIYLKVGKQKFIH